MRPTLKNFPPTHSRFGLTKGGVSGTKRDWANLFFSPLKIWLLLCIITVEIFIHLLEMWICAFFFSLRILLQLAPSTVSCFYCYYCCCCCFSSAHVILTKLYSHNHILHLSLFSQLLSVAIVFVNDASMSVMCLWYTKHGFFFMLSQSISSIIAGKLKVLFSLQGSSVGGKIETAFCTHRWW